MFLSISLPISPCHRPHHHHTARRSVIHPLSHTGGHSTLTELSPDPHQSLFSRYVAETRLKLPRDCHATATFRSHRARSPCSPTWTSYQLGPYRVPPFLSPYCLPEWSATTLRTAHLSNSGLWDAECEQCFTLPPRPSIERHPLS